MKQVAENIKKFRELRNLSREQVAAELDMSLSGYSKIERGETELSLGKLNKIASVLGVDVAQILSFDASQVFNISNNENVNAGVKTQNVYYGEGEVLFKYTKLLEEEVARLREQVSVMKEEIRGLKEGDNG